MTVKPFTVSTPLDPEISSVLKSPNLKKSNPLYNAMNAMNATHRREQTCQREQKGRLFAQRNRLPNLLERLKPLYTSLRMGLSRYNAAPKSAAQSCRLRNLLSSLPAIDTKPAPTQKEFTLFPTLPSELRAKIIGFAAHEPRQVLLSYDRKFFSHYHASSSLTSLPQRHIPKDDHAPILNAKRSRMTLFVYANFAADHFKILPNFQGGTERVQLWNYYNMETCNFTDEVLGRIKYLSYTPSLHELFPYRLTATLKYFPNLKKLGITATGSIPWHSKWETSRNESKKYLERELYAVDISKKLSDGLKSLVDWNPARQLHLKDKPWGVRWVWMDAGADEDLVPTQGGGNRTKRNDMLLNAHVFTNASKMLVPNSPE
ncbi:uncharacterized protein RAG0_17150 [Rhynchosporium agropyri]|uniref:Uncharacterized protein n=1 Tax=Rhynchosporium agropyri TaxID=914238 RepID=A0A1E1LT29_9HELO|nr:uncharacterized protein RAG0_17150 [Rhynchosporium agropyri]